MNQCWNIVKWSPVTKIQWNCKRNTNIFILQNYFWKCRTRNGVHLFRPLCVKWILYNSRSSTVVIVSVGRHITIHSPNTIYSPGNMFCVGLGNVYWNTTCYIHFQGYRYAVHRYLNNMSLQKLEVYIYIDNNYRFCLCITETGIEWKSLRNMIVRYILSHLLTRIDHQ